MYKNSLELVHAKNCYKEYEWHHLFSGGGGLIQIFGSMLLEVIHRKTRLNVQGKTECIIV